MKRAITIAIFVLIALASSFAQAAQSLQFDEAWSRATVPGAPTAAIYGTLVNTGPTTLTVLSVATDIARMGQVHESVMEHDMMHMRHIEALMIAPGQSAEFSPGGLHIMLMGLSRQLKEGETFEVRLRTDDGEELTVPVIVGSIGQMAFPGNQ